MATTRSRDGRQTFARIGFLSDKNQRLQKSSQHPRLVIAFSIICVFITIGFGSYFFSKMTVDSENISSKLISMESQQSSMQTDIKDIQDDIQKIEMDNDNLSSQLIIVDKNIKAINEKMRAPENIMSNNNHPTSQLTDMDTNINKATDAKIRASENTIDKDQISQLAKNISYIEERIHAIEVADALEEKCLRSLDGMNATGQFIWKFHDYESRIGKMRETNCYYSDPFYSSQFGYKMHVLCKVTENCVQLGIKMLIGKCDNVLTWPFKGEIKLRILDQSPKPENMRTDWFISPWDQNQRNDERVLLETPCEFVTRKRLSSRNFIRDDTLYIAVKVDEELHLDFD